MKTYVCLSGNRGGPMCSACDSNGKRKCVPIMMSQCSSPIPTPSLKSRYCCPSKKNKAKSYKCKCKQMAAASSCEKPTCCCQCRPDSSDETDGGDICSLFKGKGKGPFQIIYNKMGDETCSSDCDEDSNVCEDSDACSDSEDECCPQPEPKNIFIVMKKDKKKKQGCGNKKKKNYKIFNCCM